MKLIIDVDEEIVRKGFEQSLTEEERNTLIRAIGNGKSYNPTGDLISRSALKAELDDYIDDSLLEIADVKELINNAQVVEAYPFEQVRELIELNQQFAQEIENLKRPQGTCKTCVHRDPGDKKCDCGGQERLGCLFPVSDNYFCKFYEKGGAE